MGDRSFLDARRWHTVSSHDDRAEAVAEARRLRRANAFGSGRAFRVKRSAHSGKYVVEHAAAMSERERKHGAHYNRKMIEDERGQRRMGL